MKRIVSVLIALALTVGIVALYRVLERKKRFEEAVYLGVGNATLDRVARDLGMTVRTAYMGEGMRVTYSPPEVHWIPGRVYYAEFRNSRLYSLTYEDIWYIDDYHGEIQLRMADKAKPSLVPSR